MLANIMKPIKILFIVLLLTISGCMFLGNSYKSHIDGTYIPRNLNEAIVEIDKDLNDSLKTVFKNQTEEEFTTQSHFGTGLYIRNEWNLWGGSRLSRYFNRKDIFHPDDMSGIILTSYHRHLTGKEINLIEQINYYKKYWEGVEVTELPKKSEHPEPNLEFRYAKSYGHFTVNKKWATLYVQTNSNNESFWIYDYYFGWKKVVEITLDEIKGWRVQETEQHLETLYKK
ncbi:MAG TPA: hypothetical protein DCL80_10140 [Balneola sp.]|jgi:hypothetical protein|nr:hypothetical protein [Balneola sp.]|tara:strand:+ start:455 stop:1138 length:684 start_codon:yes stop_codon:yes gene_type:complete